MPAINIYLNFPGNTEEAFNFYKSVFGGTFSAIQHYRDSPEGEKLSNADKNKIMHIALPVNENDVLMASDIPDSMKQTYIQGNNFYISIQAKSREEAENLFNRLSAGGKAEMPLSETFWGSYFGILKDKFGINWMVSCDVK